MPGEFVSPIFVRGKSDGSFCLILSLPQFTSLPNGYSEGSSKFTKLLMSPLSVLIRAENILVAGYFDDLFTLSKNFRGCFDNVFKIMKIISH